MASVGRSVRVTGHVQGVFFRGWTVEQARELDVTGWVRNCPDGSVEARLSGDDQAVTQLIDRMRRGPPGAQVTRLEVTEAAPEASEGFTVRRS